MFIEPKTGKVIVVHKETKKRLAVFAVDARELVAQGEYELVVKSIDPLHKEIRSDELTSAMENTETEHAHDGPNGTAPDSLDDDDDIILEELNVPALQSLCDERELPTKGLLKKDIIEALLAHDEAANTTPVSSD